MGGAERGAVWDITVTRPRLPRWVTLLVGGLAITVGVLLATRPLTSLQALALYLGAALLVLGTLELFSERATLTAWGSVRALGAAVLGVLVLTWLRHDFDLLALVVGAALTLAGVRRLWLATRGGHPTRSDAVASGLLGAAEVIIGTLAVRWPDLTLLTVAVFFAVRLVLLGLRLLRRGLTRRPRPTACGRVTAPWARVVDSALALVLALGAGSLAVAARTQTPTVDGFYAAPTEVPSEPGVLLRSETFSAGVPEGARGWRILYTTTTADGSPATASGLVVTPGHSGEEPAPVIAWAHGTTGFATRCAPSLLAEPFEAGAMYSLDRVIRRGWAMVAPDYTGLGTPGPHPYLIGAREAHSVLDAVRAAQQIQEADLATETVLWGHSQGGHAALWTAQLADDYAPDLDLLGVAALAPAADVVALATSLPDVVGGELFAAYVIAAYTGHYDELVLAEQVIPPARTLVREMAGRCLAEPSILASVVSVLSLSRDQSVYAEPPAEGALGQRLRENVPTGPFDMPVLVGQGEADGLVLPEDQAAYVDRLCAAGPSLDYRTYPERDHIGLIEPDSPLIHDLFRWTDDRLDGDQAPGC